MKHCHALTAFGLVLTFTAGCAFSDFRKRYTVDELLAAGIDRIEVANPGGAALYPNFESRWYNHSVSSPTVDFDGQTYRMWFLGISMADEEDVPYGFAERVGLATSKDGRRWTVANGGRPVLPWGEPGKFDDKGIAHPFVLRVGGKFMMWYGGIDGRVAKDIGEAPGHVRIEQIGLAISEDGVHWEKANGGEPVLKLGPKGAIDSIQATGCHVIRRGDEFVMWYGAYDGLHTIGLATSPDGIVWTKQNDGRSLPGLAGEQQLGPTVYFDGSRYLMFYNTGAKVPTGGGIWTLFAATSDDGITWQPVMDGRQLLGPAPVGNFASADGIIGNNHAVHPTKLIFAGGQVLIWYGGESNHARPGTRYGVSAIGLMGAKPGQVR